MYRGTYPLQKDWALKVIRSMSYLLMSLAGGLLLISPIFRSVFPTFGDIMAAFLAVGGMLAFLGAVVERWFGEYVGLPLLSSGFLVFAILGLYASGSDTPFIAWANFTLLTGLSLSLMDRWKQVRTIYRVAVRASDRRYE